MSEGEANKLPKGWVDTNLELIVEKMTNGSNLKQSDQFEDGMFPISRIETIANENIDLTRVKYVSPNEDEIEKYSLQNGDILFSHINSDKHLGKTALFDLEETIIHGINLLLIRPVKQYNSELLNYLFRHYRYSGKFIEVAQRSVNQSSINQKKLKSFKVPLPPLAEQQRIVAKLDSLFGHLEQVKARLEKVPEILKNFRQAVLTQAVTGKLTEEWRSDCYRNGKELEKLNIISNLNDSYFHPKLPNSWVNTTIDKVGLVKGGKRLPKGHELVIENTGLPYIRARDLKEGTVLTKNMMFLLPETQKLIKNYIVKQDDLYITIVGAKIGDAGIIPVSMNGANLTENAAKITDTNPSILPNYLALWLRGAICQNNIQQTIMSAAQGKLALTRIKQLPIYLPPQKEQTEIVRRVESLFAKADAIEQKYSALKEKIDTLPQALLAKAFRGELVEQLESDESAEELLKEIERMKLKTKLKRR